MGSVWSILYVYMYICIPLYIACCRKYLNTTKILELLIRLYRNFQQQNQIRSYWVAFHGENSRIMLHLQNLLLCCKYIVYKTWIKLIKLFWVWKVWHKCYNPFRDLIRSGIGSKIVDPFRFCNRVLEYIDRGRLKKKESCSMVQIPLTYLENARVRRVWKRLLIYIFALVIPHTNN